MTERESVGFRLEREILERLDALATRLSQPGLPVTRSAALRVAVLAGLDVLEGKTERAKPRKTH